MTFFCFAVYECSCDSMLNMSRKREFLLKGCGVKMQMFVWINETKPLPSLRAALQHAQAESTRGRILSPSIYSPSRPPGLFSENCLIALIHSNRITLSVFSGQTFHTTGAISSCTFHLFLMAGPYGTGPGGSLLPPLPPWFRWWGRYKNLRSRPCFKKSIFLCTKHPAISSKPNRDLEPPS